MAEAWTSSHSSEATAAGATAAEPTVQRITVADVGDALRRGWQDFLAAPTQLVFLGLIYPLVGPVAAIGIYEISRRRERGWAVSWLDAFSVLRSPAILSIVALGLMLLVIFGLWVLAAQWIYDATLGAVAQPHSVGEFTHLVFNTPEGWRLILIGNAVGFLFAV